MSEAQEEIAKALRALVGAMYQDLHGADAYEGQYEAEIQALARAILDSIPIPCEHPSVIEYEANEYDAQ